MIHLAGDFRRAAAPTWNQFSGLHNKTEHRAIANLTAEFLFQVKGEGPQAFRIAELLDIGVFGFLAF